MLDNFGVVSSGQLRTAGLDHSQIRRLLRAGTLDRVRHGWYSDAHANPAVVRAVNAGGVLSGPAALKLHDVWTPPDQPVHVRLRRSEQFSATGGNAGLVPFVLPRGRAIRMHRSVDRPGSALLTSMLVCPRDTAVVLTDSLLHLGLLARDQVELIAHRAGAPGAAVMRVASATAGSGTETLFRLWLIRNRIKFRAQLPINGVGVVDFVIGRKLVVEIDSRAHHTGAENFANDRRRDRALIALGYRIIRLTYAEVMYHLEEVGQDIIALVRRDAHR